MHQMAYLTSMQRFALPLLALPLLAARVMAEEDNAEVSPRSRPAISRVRASKGVHRGRPDPRTTEYSFLTGAQSRDDHSGVHALIPGLEETARLPTHHFCISARPTSLGTQDHLGVSDPEPSRPQLPASFGRSINPPCPSLPPSRSRLHVAQPACHPSTMIHASEPPCSIQP